MFSRSKRGLKVFCLRGFTSTSPRVMPNREPAGRSTLLTSVGVSWRTLMGYPSYARNCTCALPSPSPLPHVMAKIVPAVQLAAYAKSSTLYGCLYSRKSNFFRLDELLLWCIIMGLRRARCARCELCYKQLS